MIHQLILLIFKVYYGTKEMENRTSFCVEKTSSYLYNEVGEMYVREKFSQAMKDEVDKMKNLSDSK